MLLEPKSRLEVALQQSLGTSDQTCTDNLNLVKGSHVESPSGVGHNTGYTCALRIHEHAVSQECPTGTSMAIGAFDDDLLAFR